MNKKKSVQFSQFRTGGKSICVVGLGYVGLPLAIALANKFRVIGLDLNKKRINDLKNGIDKTGELSKQVLERASLQLTTDPKLIAKSGIVIVTVPTPITVNRQPDLEPLVRASKMIGENIKPGTIVVYESTVYPGCTEEECIPIIERESGLKSGKDFFVGYSPERINPGDKIHTVTKITKVVSGDTPATARFIAEIYGEIITAGIYIAPSIKVAEAAKVIENTQRDLNIALMNELAMIFDRQGINTLEVLRAAGTKWNFLKFQPGLVGGHCIGVDPYYLTYKAQSLGISPEVILSGRRINDGMGKFVAEKTVKLMISYGHQVKAAKVLLIGLTFKENVSDIRNSRAFDIAKELKVYGVEAIGYDPHADPIEVKTEHQLEVAKTLDGQRGCHAVILAVKHEDILKNLTVTKLKTMGLDRPPVIIDVKGFFSEAEYNEASLTAWQL